MTRINTETDVRATPERCFGFGLIGRTVDSLILKSYLTRLLQIRNTVVKNAAEAGD